MDPGHIGHLSSALVAFCGVADAYGAFGIAVALFGTGLVGSFAHCAPMCGPFVMMQLTEPDGGGFALRKLAAGALPGYQLGRMTTYAALGLLVGGLGGSLVALTQFHWLLALLLGLAAASFLLQAVKGILPWLAGAAFAGLGSRFAPLLARLIRSDGRLALRGFPLGLVLGFLPCGFLYAALIAAAATGGAAAGGIAMAGFALGTMPALVVVGLLGAGAALRWRRFAVRLATPVFLVNALTLAGLAARALA
jgi:sulfite exporter TauE/SafE